MASNFRLPTFLSVFILGFLNYANGQNQCLNGGVLVLRPAVNVDQVCLCNKNFIGPRCETNLLLLSAGDRLRYGCELRPCWIGSTCEDRPGGGFVCHCSANTYGDFCEQSSLQINNPCISKPCYNLGTCIQQDQNSYTCACNGSYGGLGCRQNLMGACASNPCQRDGICIPVGATDYKCQCPEWTIGKNCEVVFNPCQRVNCMNNGICLKRRTLAFECNCTQEYTGVLCDQPKVQSCLAVPCAFGQCILNPMGQFSCACISPGYEGPFCEVEKCNPKCKYGYCNRDQSGNYYCVCGGPYRGPACADLVCFAASTLIDTKERGSVQISELRKGDLIKTFDPAQQKWVYSKFVTYLHADRNVLARYVSIKTSANRSLHASAKHFVARWTSEEKIEYVFARDLKLGDRLITESKSESGGYELEEIVELGETFEYGAFAPLTETGTLSVNSILASCYANTIIPEIAHYLFKPIVLLSKLFDSDYLYYDSGAHDHASIESGIYWYARFFYNLVPYIPFSSHLVSF